MPKAKLVNITPNYMDLLKLAASKPYGKDVTDRTIEGIIKSGHHSVLEHCTASFEVKCSVRVLGQITRHRFLSFTVKSARGSKYTHVIDPKIFEAIPMENAYCARPYLDVKEVLPEQEAAYSLPQNAETEFVVTGNFRAWFNYLPLRLCQRAMPEHRALAEVIYKALKHAAPEIFDRNFLNCAHCTERSCSFK